MDDKNTQQQSLESTSQDVSATNENVARADRRKLIRKAGIIAPGVLLLANRPALAASCSISGFMSAKIGTSLTSYDEQLCDGWSPGNWKKNVGAITDQAWSQTGVWRTDKFNSQFKTYKLSTGIIRKLVNGVPEASEYNYTSQYASTFQSILEGYVSGSYELKSTIKHAAACLLNALFLQNGGPGGTPQDWMVGYISPDDAVALFLLYELRYHTSQAAGVTFQYERNGFVVAKSDALSYFEYNNYFTSLANGPS